MAAVRSSGAASPPAATPTAPTTQAAAGPWTAVPHLTANLPLVVSHADPHVAYVVTWPGNGATQAVLRRTDNDGATWTDLLIPHDVDTAPDGTTHAAGIVYLQLAASPVDPRVVLLGVQDVSPTCPAPYALATTGGRLFAGAPVCFFDYFSADGGAHWRRLSLPLNGLLALGIGTPASGLHGQAGTLYAMLAPYAAGRGAGLNTPRLVASEDGGGSWRLADAPLAASSQDIVAYAPIPGEAGGLYAMTCPDVTCPNGINLTSGTVQAPLELWRSDDAGAHWLAIGAVPNSVRGDVPAVGLAAATSSLLYVETSGTPDQPGQDHVEVSADGGHSWAWAPVRGGPTDMGRSQQLLGVRGDGTALIAFSRTGMGVSRDTIVYAWKARDAALRAVTPPLVDAAYVDDLWVAPGGAPASGSIWTVVQTASGYTARWYALA